MAITLSVSQNSFGLIRSPCRKNSPVSGLTNTFLQRQKGKSVRQTFLTYSFLISSFGVNFLQSETYYISPKLPTLNVFLSLVFEYPEQQELVNAVYSGSVALKEEPVMQPYLYFTAIHINETNFLKIQ